MIEAQASRERVDKVLARLVPEASRSTVQRWISEDRVRIDGCGCRARDLVGPGQLVEVEPGPPPASGAEPDPSVVFSIVYQDAHLMVVDKPAGLVVHPARGHRSGTLVHGLLAQDGFSPPPDARDPRGAERPGIVHRIDKDTSGLLVIAKDGVTREGLKSQLFLHRMERVYLAITAGIPSATTISTLHARDPRSRLRFTSRTSTGRSAITHLAVRQTYGGGRAALVECRLETGRTHQIRVHLAEQTRTPLLGDALYGAPPADPEVRAIAQALGRQALHAQVLGFLHPVLGCPMRFQSELPYDLREALAALGRLRD